MKITLLSVNMDSPDLIGLVMSLIDPLDNWGVSSIIT